MENPEEKNVKEEVQGMITKSVDEKAVEVNKSLEETRKSLETKHSESAERITASEAKIKSLEEQAAETKKELEEKTETIKELGKSLKENKVEKQRKETYAEIIRKSVIEKAEEIKKLDSSEAKIKVEKAADVVTIGGSLIDGDGNAATGYISDFEQGVTNIQRRTPNMRNLVRTRGITTAYAKWVEEVEGQGSPAPTGENVTKPQMDIKWLENEAKVKKIPVFTKISEEALEDIEWAADEIASELSEKVLIEEDNQILNGDGTGDNYKGIMAYAPVFTVSSAANTAFYQKIAGANRLDVLRTAVAIIASKNFSANTIILNPVDAALIDMTKDLTNNYILVPFTTVNGTELRRITIIEDNGIDVNKFLVGDMSKSNYRIRKDLSIIFGREKDDLTKNLYTIVAELRGCHYIKNNHVNAFLKGEFTTAITMLDEVTTVTP